MFNVPLASDRDRNTEYFKNTSRAIAILFGAIALLVFTLNFYSFYTC
ncbi:hypothetical protein QUB05_01725 [Microcoleus sp. F10-C6]